MIEVLQTVVALIVTLSILVTIHEYGHYCVARFFNVQVLRFSVGFGRPLFTFRGKPPEDKKYSNENLAANNSEDPIQTRSNEPLSGPEFVIAAIPLGGYVKMLDEREGYVPDDRLHLAFNRKPVLQRMAIAAAGPAANFLLAIVAYWVLFVVGVAGVVPMLGEPVVETPAAIAGIQQGQEILYIDDEATPGWADVNMQLFKRIGDTGEVKLTVRPAGNIDSERTYLIPINEWLADEEAPNPAYSLGLKLDYPTVPALIGGVVVGGAAEAAGIRAGDHIVRANGMEIATWEEFVVIVQANPAQPIDLQVERAGGLINLAVTPRSIEQSGKRIGFVGAQRTEVALPEEMQRMVRYPFYSAWIPALDKTWSVTVFMLESIQKMILGDISPKNLSGPITIAKIAKATAQSGLESFVGFITLLSISLAVLNLMPIPILDGGHLLYYTVELVLRRPVPDKVQQWGLQMGMFIIVSVMLLAFYNDLMRL
ncbi:MAG: RIP metalloprotease RseP [Pseudomonadales bacterium]|nr:RIP metalloprotease RseP [Pseudomonadales bacterium]